MVKTSYSVFAEQYDKWQADCLIEFNIKYNDSRTMYCDDTPDGDYDPGDLVEFSDAGDAYPHGIGGTNWIPRAVTPWARSPHYVD